MNIEVDFLNEDNILYRELKPIINGLGYEIVDFNSRQKEGNLSLSISIYKSEGITIDDCATVHRTVYPRIELLEDVADINLQISSPGSTRKIKSIDEFRIFSGKNVGVLTYDDTEWIHGRIESVGNGSLEIGTKEGTVSIDYSDIKKAKLE